MRREALTMKVYVKLAPAAATTLLRLAEVEKRHPSDQAALILERALARRTPKEKEAAVTT